MQMMSDATLYLLIKEGAATVGFPPGMPAFGEKLGYDQIAALARFVRSLCAGQTNERDRVELTGRRPFEERPVRESATLRGRRLRETSF